MMTKSNLDMIWDHIRILNGIAVRCVANLPADKLDAHPIPRMRTPKELVVHMYTSSMRSMMEGLLSGNYQEYDEKSACERIQTKDDLLRFCDESWKASDRAERAATDAHLAGEVKTPWGHAMPGPMCVQVVRDELLHHRGQLYAYLRALGQEVPDMYDYANNAPEFRRREPAQA
ncbi:MAG TPA: DinB family protein [Candidatus Sulfotelmatobacter sp.]|nr:DinB family protein [Candidatus Sulfotelmatobacter sp.]